MAKVGLIGLGKWGINHLATLLSLECDLVGVVDTDEIKKEIADGHGLKFYRDYKEIINKIDAAIVVTPTNTHYDIVKNFLQAGKHVFVEKPIAENAERGKELVELAKKSNLILSVGYLYRFNNAVKRVKDILNEVGEIQYITCRYIHSTKPPREDTGVILNLGIHMIDILNFILDKLPSRVYAKKKNLISKKFEDSAIILLDYDKFFVEIELSCTHPEKARDMWIIAEKEKIYADYLKQNVVRFPIKINYNNVRREKEYEEKIEPNEPLREELRYFLDLVERGEVDPEKNIGRENYYTTKICELCLESAISGKEIAVT